MAKYGYNNRLQKKISKNDEDWDVWYWCMGVVAFELKHNSSPENIRKCGRLLKFQLAGTRYFQSTRVHDHIKQALNWMK